MKIAREQIAVEKIAVVVHRTRAEAGLIEQFESLADLAAQAGEPSGPAKRNLLQPIPPVVRSRVGEVTPVLVIAEHLVPGARVCHGCRLGCSPNSHYTQQNPPPHANVSPNRLSGSDR